MARGRSRLPFLPVAPAIVLVLGVAAALIVVLLGVRDLLVQSDAHAHGKAELLAKAVAQRLRSTASEDRAALVERATSRGGVELLLVRQDGHVEIDGSVQRPAPDAVLSYLVAGSGTTWTGLGRSRFFVEPLGPPLEHLSLVVLSRAPETPAATGPLVTSVAALAAVLLVIAALFAFALAKDVRSDVVYVRARIAEMAREDSSPAGKPIVARSLDQVGLLTSAFNVLVDRFTAAEGAYRQDLAGALAYDRDRSAFLAALSHELRTPLNAILGFTDVLLSEVDGPLTSEARENLEVVRRSGDHLKHLIGDILDLSALESGELRLNRGLTDVRAIAAEVVREAEASAQGRPLDLDLHGDAEQAWVDPLRVRQIIGNLVGNAVKFTAEGRVGVTIEGRPRFVAILVEDTGPGIAPEEQAAIFDEYRQAGDASSRRAGTGLGLAITRRLVQMHGGYVELESEVGRGARFTVVLPRDPPDRPRTDADRSGAIAALRPVS